MTPNLELISRGKALAETRRETPPWARTANSLPEDAIDGGRFIFDQPEGIPCLWGRGNQVLWPSGEAFMIAGSQGLGKSTLAGLLVRDLLGLGPGKLLGLPVIDIGCKILYLAMDRPKQIARSMARQFTPADNDVISERLIVRPGPPPRDLAAVPTLLAQMADYYGAGIVFVDSLKDAAVGLKEDEVGARYNRARQHLVAQGVELAELHHSTKANTQGASPTSIDRVFGSTWLTSGCGSIVLLTGEPGDPIVGFRHVKQPAEEVGPYRLLHDQTVGAFSIEHSVDLLALVKSSGADGLTAKDAAAATTDKPNPARAEIEKARRKLVQLEENGLLQRIDGGSGRGATTAWFLAAEKVTQKSRATETRRSESHAGLWPNGSHAEITEVTPATKHAGQKVTQ